MFLPNDILEYADAAGGRHALRVLWIDAAAGLACTYPLGRGGALPRLVPLRRLVADVQARRARLSGNDPWRARAGRDAATVPSASQRRLQAKAWQAVQWLHLHLPALYERRARAALVAHYCALHGTSPASVMRYLRRYWERGQTPDALLPDYGNCGAPGRTRQASAGVKRGRPPKDPPAGPNIDAALRALFQAAVADHVARHRRFSRPAAYRRMLEDHFADAAPGAIPSYGQFCYWLDRDRLALPAGRTPPR